MAADPRYAEHAAAAAAATGLSFTFTKTTEAVDESKLTKPTYTISTNEGTKYVITKQQAIHSILISTIAESGGEDDIPLPDLFDEEFKRILVFIDHVNTTGEKPVKFTRPFKPTDTSMTEYKLSPWFDAFISCIDAAPESDPVANEKRAAAICRLVKAANYLDIPALFDLGRAKIAFELRKSTVDKIREIFGIKNDFTPEEEETLAKTDFWDTVSA